MSDIIFGRNPIVEALDSDIQVEKVFLHIDIKGPFEIEIRKKCKEANIPLHKVNERKLFQLSRNKNHQGIAAYISPVKFAILQDIIPHLYESGKTPLFLMLDGVSDVRNFGAIARTALVLGVNAIIVGTKNAARIGEDAVKTSAGAILKIPIIRVTSLVNTLSELSENGIVSYASDLNSRNAMDDMDFKVPCTIIMGSEDRGVSPATLRSSDKTFKISQVSAFDSLNVSVATGVVLYEAFRQRNN